MKNKPSKILIFALVIALVDICLKWAMHIRLIDVNFIYNYGFVLGVLEESRSEVGFLQYFVVVYLNIAVFLSKKLLKDLKVYSFSAWLTVFLIGTNGNLIEKIFHGKVTDYISIPFVDLMLNLSDFLLVGAILLIWIECLKFAKKPFGMSTANRRSGFGGAIQFQKKLFWRVFFASNFIQVPWLLFVFSFYSESEGKMGVMIKLLIVVSFGLMNSLFLSLLILEKNIHSVGVLEAIKRSFEVCDDPKKFEVNLRGKDYHNELIEVIENKVKSFSKNSIS